MNIDDTSTFDPFFEESVNVWYTLLTSEADCAKAWSAVAEKEDALIRHMGFLQVVSAVVQYVCTASSQTAAALPSTSQDAAAVGAQAELAAAISLLTAILASQ